MRQEQFEGMMPVITADIIGMITAKRGVSEKDAIKQLYASKLYMALEQEETKVWQYSTPKLYSLLEEEWATGTIHFPDV